MLWRYGAARVVVEARGDAEQRQQRDREQRWQRDPPAVMRIGGSLRRDCDRCRCRLQLWRTRHCRNKYIAATMHGANAAFAAPLRVQHPAQRSDLDRKVGVLDGGTAPHGPDYLVLRNQLTTSLNQHPEHLERA